MTVLEVQLKELGFTQEAWGYEKRLGGEFNICIYVEVVDWDGEPVTPKVTVGLPHQCDSWTVATGENGTDVLTRMHKFTEEIDRAKLLVLEIGLKP